MSANEIHIQTTKLLNQISEIKNESITENIFITFINHAKTESNMMMEMTSDQEIRIQLSSISNFRTYDELSLVERIFIRVFVFRFQFNWVGSWKKVGKYWNDLHNIELKLQGIQYKLHNQSKL